MIYVIPSIYAHILNGLLLLLACVIFYKNYSTITRVEPYKLIMLIVIFSIGIGIHGLSHLGLEHQYNFNPIKIVFE